MPVIIDFFSQKLHGVTGDGGSGTVTVGRFVVAQEIKGVEGIGGGVEDGGGDAGSDGFEGECGIGGVFGVELLAFGCVWFGGDCFD